MAPSKLIIPSQIPWDKLNNKELEEFLYWLLDAMGAKNIEWRIGGKGNGAPDQGRDLECTFYLTSVEGLIKQRWWIDAKGRSKTVRPTDVKETIFNAAGKTEVDVVLLATNAYFSNPTRDWVKEFQEKHATPIIKLWDRTELEKLCCEFPQSITRMFLEALTSQGKLAVICARFWDHSTFTDLPLLKVLWKEKENLSISEKSLIALAASECATGDVTYRSWGMFVNEDTLFNALATYLGNFFFLALRADACGVNQEPHMKAVSYLTLCCIHRFGAEAVSSFFLDDWSKFGGESWSKNVKNFIFKPMLNTLLTEISDVCTWDCKRISKDLENLSEQEINRYWCRLRVSNEEEKRKRILTLYNYDKPCKVGFCGEGVNVCPVTCNEHPEKRIHETLLEIETIVRFRRGCIT